MEMTPKQKRDALVEEAGVTPDEAAHMLIDMGEINSIDHEEILSTAERRRVYGD